MTVFVWIALAFFVVAAVGTGIHAGTAGLRAWRDFRRFNRRFTDGMTDVERLLFAMEQKVDKANARQVELVRAQARLNESLAGARALAAAFAEFRALLAFMPR